MSCAGVAGIITQRVALRVADGVNDAILGLTTNGTVLTGRLERMRMIDGDALLRKICGECCGCEPEQCGYLDEYRKERCKAGQYVVDAPTVCVPQDTPLRCRTCSFFVDTDGGLCTINGLGRCSMFGGERSADDYCSKGAWLSNAIN